MQVVHNSHMGGICDNNFTGDDALVTCRSLGYDGARGFCCGILGGDEDVPIWMRSLTCSGSEDNLFQCGFHGWGGDTPECKLKEDQPVVVCYHSAQGDG